MASQEFLASFAVDIDEGGVSRLQQVLEENRTLAEEVAAAFEAATAAIREYQKAALGGDNPSGERNRDDGSGKAPAVSKEEQRDPGRPLNPEASARNLENGEYRSEGYKGEVQGMVSGALTENPDATVRDYSLRTAELMLAHALAPDEGYDVNEGRRPGPESLPGGEAYYDAHGAMEGEISRYLYDTLGPRSDSELGQNVHDILSELSKAEANGEDTGAQLEQLKAYMPELVSGVRAIVDRYDRPDDGSGSSKESDSQGPYNPEASARNLENGEYRSAGYKGEIQGLLSGSLTANPDGSVRDYSLRTAELLLAHALAPDEEYDRNTGNRASPERLADGEGYYDSHSGLEGEIGRYLYNTVGPRADSDYARELNTALRNLADAEAKGDDTAEYLEQVKSLMPDLIRGVKDIVDRYDEPPEPAPPESREEGGLEGSLDLEGARGELEAFREEAAQPVALSGNASGIVSAASAALSSVKSMFAQPLTIKAVVETEGEGGDGETGGSPLKMSAGGRFTKPTDVQVAEDGDAEYIIPVKKENRAVPLLKQLLGELSPEARQRLAGEAETGIASETEPLRQAAIQPLAAAGGRESMPDASGLLAKLGDLLSVSLHETAAPVTQMTNQNVSAPVTIQVRSTGADAEQVGRSLYDTAERYLLRTLQQAI